MANLNLPPHHEPMVDVNTGRITDVWYRFLFKNVTEVTTVELTATAPLSISTANVISIAASTLGFAGQAEQEAGASTSAVITPSVQQYHPSAAKAWAHVTLAGTVATVTTGYNVNSAESTATGLLKVNLATSFSSTNYVVNGMARIADSILTNHSVTHPTSIGLETTTFTLLCQANDGTNAAPTAWYVVCYGDQ